MEISPASAVQHLCYFAVPWKTSFLIVAEAHVPVVIKQEKMEETKVVPESEKKLQSCFCPHGYSTATTGHYHCRYCGLSLRALRNLLVHEKVHTDYIASGADASQQPKTSQFYSCRHCGYLCRSSSGRRTHEVRVHAKSRQATDQQESKSQSATTQVGTSILLENIMSEDYCVFKWQEKVDFTVS